MKKILFRGPVLSRSGYGEQARFALRALRAHQDRFDIYVWAVGWGATGCLYEDTEEKKWIHSIIDKTAAHNQSGGQYDISLQVTIPNEWERLAPVNVGYTAGIETTQIAPIWIEKSMIMDKIITTSNHAKEGFDNTSYQAQNEQTGQIIEDFKCTTPIESVNYAYRKVEPCDVELDLEYDFNFLSISQWSPRKNMENMVRWFFEEFANDEVGLVLKISLRNNSTMDREHTYIRFNEFTNAMREKYPDSKCKIYLLHGDMREEEMTALYLHPKIKGLINLAHGEGFGLPMFEAAYNSLPVVCPAWGGQKDFLYMPLKDKKKKNKIRKTAMFAAVDYAIQQVQPEAAWGLGELGPVLIPESSWCYPHEGNYKSTLRDVYKNYGQYLSKAKKLKKYIQEEFSQEKQYKKFADAVYIPDEHELEDWMTSLNVEEHN
tara:strand:- start:3490 stop:4785 length:1296 start_codon:yes stop_codon:yes gene_type:complete